MMRVISWRLKKVKEQAMMNVMSSHFTANQKICFKHASSCRETHFWSGVSILWTKVCPAEEPKQRNPYRIMRYLYSLNYHHQQEWETLLWLSASRASRKRLCCQFFCPRRNHKGHSHTQANTHTTWMNAHCYHKDTYAKMHPHIHSQWHDLSEVRYISQPKGFYRVGLEHVQ